MKYLLLFLFWVTFQTIIFAQTNYKGATRMLDKTPDPASMSEGDVIVGQKLSESLIGQTWYDLQTYGSMSQRIYAYPDGTVGAVWMIGFETTNWTDRGTGYNYYDGGQWGEMPAQKLESIRTGWGCYAPLGPNGEIVVSHAQPSDDWVLLFNKRENKGTGDWQEFTLGGPVVGTGIVWPAMVTNGPDHNTIHILAHTYTTPYMGQDGALLYSRSSDGGQTWDIQNHFFEELGPDYFVSIDADAYDWAEPVGNTIAFSVGFDCGHAAIMKSTDNGENWEFIQVYQCPLYPPPGTVTPSFGAGDGTQSVAIDNSGNVHVVFGRMVYIYDETGALFYYPSTYGLIYWNESMPELDSTLISSYTTDFLMQSGNLVGWIVEPGPSSLTNCPSYYSSLTSHPQILIDANNRIFVLYMGAAPTYNNGTNNYRHIYGNSSNDGGLTWNGIKDFNSDLVYIFSECIYPAMSPLLYENKINFWFENDNEPGIFVWTAQQPVATLNNITFMSVETGFLTGIGEDNKISPDYFSVSQNFPNPFYDVTIIDVDQALSSSLLFRVFDVRGQMVHSEPYQKNGDEKLRITFARKNLPSGIYYYSIISDYGSECRQMIIE
jgi:hypothetical protein